MKVPVDKYLWPVAVLALSTLAAGQHTQGTKA